jgi:hypothetical protein
MLCAITISYSVVGIATIRALQPRDLIPVRMRFSILVQTSPGAKPAPYTIGIEGKVAKGWQ